MYENQTEFKNAVPTERADRPDRTEKLMAAREVTARELLTEHIERSRQQISDLDALLRALPAELPYQADRALKRILWPDKFA